MPKHNPINETDAAAIAQARGLLHAARFGALAVLHPETGTPHVSRVALLWAEGRLLTLISSLSIHTRALQATPACAVLIGEPSGKGDPLTHPRITITARAGITDKSEQKDRWLSAMPKATLYYDFADFGMFALTPTEAHLNGGFGKAYYLSPDDLGTGA